MAEKWVKNLIVASAMAFSIFLGFGLILPLFPFYVDELGGGGTELGILFSSFMLTRAFLARPFGKLSDRIGRKKVMVTGMFLYSLLAFLFTIPDNWFGLIFVRILQGTASAMVWPVGEALVVDSAPSEKRTRALSLYIILSSIGFIIGPIFSGGVMIGVDHIFNVAEVTKFRIPFYFTSGIALTGAIFGLIYLRDVLPQIKDRGKRELEIKKALSQLVPKIKRSLYALYTNSFFEGLSWSLGGIVMALFMLDVFDMSAEGFAILFGVAQGIGLGFVYISGVRSDKTKKKPFVVFGSLGSKISTILLSFTPLVPGGIWLAFATYSAKDTGRQIAAPATRSLQADLAPVRLRGRLIATIQAYSNIGALIGGLIGGTVWDYTHDREFNLGIGNLQGYTIPFLLSASLGIIAAIIVWIFVYEPPKGENIG